MFWLQRLRYRARTLIGRVALEEQLDEELQFHLDMQTSANIRLGMSPMVARALARRQFGSVESHKDAYRDRWGARHLETLWQDIRSGVRHALAHRGTSLAVVVALALGIGANTAVFSVFNSVLLRPLPYSEEDRLVRLQAWSAPDGRERLFSAPEIRDLRVQARSLRSVAEFHFMYFILLDRQEPQRVAAGVVSANFFDVIGVSPQLGRGFVAAEERVGAPGVIVISHRFWQDQLAGDPNVIGREFQMNDRMHTVVGVLPPLPNFPEDADIYLPTAACPLRISTEGDQNRSMRLVSALGRVSSERHDLAHVRDDLAVVSAHLNERYPSDYSAASFTMSAVAARDDLTHRFRPTLAVLVASAMFLLLILCSSVGALLLANTLRRRPEVAMRRALGAGTGRLFRQFATETWVLTIAGATAGLAVAYAALPPLVTLASRFTPRASEIHLDWAAMVFTGVLAGVTSLVFGSIIAVTAGSGSSVVAPIKNAGGGSSRPSIFTALIVLQIAVSFALLVGAGLMLRSVFNLQRIDTGYQTRDVLTMRVSADFIKYYSYEKRAELFGDVLQAVQAIPEVRSAALSGALPFTAEGSVGRDTLEIAGRPAESSAKRPLVSVQVVSPDYFDTIGLQLLGGRTFSDRDSVRAAQVAVVNSRMATRYWNGDSPIGKEIRVGDDWMTIVGVVSDGRQQLEQQPMDEVYRPLASAPLVEGLPIVAPRLFIRTTVDPATMTSYVRDAIRHVDPQQPIDSVQTLDTTREESMAAARLTAILLGLFAAIGLVISTIGVGGVVGTSVSARTREFGLRMAVGAHRRHLLVAVLQEGLALGIAGLALGAGLALLLSRALAALLYEVAPHDAVTFVSVAALLLVVLLGACLLPARRAAGVDPNVALRVA